MDLDTAQKRITYLENEIESLKRQKKVLISFTDAVSDSVNLKNIDTRGALRVLQDLQQRSLVAREAAL